MKIYYAHHQWKYGTKVEEYELDVIKKYFPDAEIFNPAIELEVDGKTEEEIMEQCYEAIKNSDMVIFSSMDGVVGKGVFLELDYASKYSIPIRYIYQHGLRITADIRIVDDKFCPVSDRIYSIVDVKSREF